MSPSSDFLEILIADGAIGIAMRCRHLPVGRRSRRQSRTASWHSLTEAESTLGIQPYGCRPAISTRAPVRNSRTASRWLQANRRAMPQSLEN